MTLIGAARFAIQLGGSLASEKMKVALDELSDKSEDKTRGKMLYEIINLSRVAVLADQTWIKKSVNLKGT